MTKITQVKAQNNYMLFVKLSNNREGLFDVSPYIDKGIFKELKQKAYFRQVRLAFGGVAWPHEQDFSADTIAVELIDLDA